MVQVRPLVDGNAGGKLHIGLEILLNPRDPQQLIVNLFGICLELSQPWEVFVTIELDSRKLREMQQGRLLDVDFLATEQRLLASLEASASLARACMDCVQRWLQMAIQLLSIAAHG